MRINTYSECVKHCATYRQTKQDTHDDRLTVSSTFNNTYKYNDIAYPTILEDVKLFEIKMNYASTFILPMIIVISSPIN